MRKTIESGAIGDHQTLQQFGPPSFTDKETEQTYIKQRLAASFRLFAYFGFDDGLAGHITARDPIDPHTFWVNPLGKHFANLCVSDLVRLNHSGEIVQGSGIVNTAAYMIHSAIHTAFPQVNAVAHAHSKYGKAWSTQGMLLEPITQDACLFFEKHSLFSHFTGVVHEKSEGEAIVEAMNADDIAVILQNHGLLTVGKSIDSAVSTFVQLEQVCENQLLVENTANKQLIPDQIARKTEAFIGSELVKWGNFQPMYELMESLDQAENSFKS